MTLSLNEASLSCITEGKSFSVLMSSLVDEHYLQVTYKKITRSELLVVLKGRLPKKSQLTVATGPVSLLAITCLQSQVANKNNLKKWVCSSSGRDEVVYSVSSVQSKMYAVTSLQGVNGGPLSSNSISFHSEYRFSPLHRHFTNVRVFSHSFLSDLSL